MCNTFTFVAITIVNESCGVENLCKTLIVNGTLTLKLPLLYLFYSSGQSIEYENKKYNLHNNCFYMVMRFLYVNPKIYSDSLIDNALYFRFFPEMVTFSGRYVVIKNYFLVTITLILRRPALESAAHSTSCFYKPTIEVLVYGRALTFILTCL
ncbi:hypothetical protein BDA99DRAFT_538726 [Phascolomyces articulosus]|uniref:Uncharacterized protein n=1 Tax=Phascolomyces articulosus TaxID=60185 RepID=A0AAD5PE53_9FUNG|nr:hypothetical protein BDA99DRAFT_538726 [Phascolomyces articulosus]